MNRAFGRSSIACLVALLGAVADSSAQPTPIPPAPYLIAGNVAGYTSIIASSSILPGTVLGTSRRPWRLGDVHRVLRYRTADRGRYAQVEVEEVADATWVGHEVEHYARWMAQSGQGSAHPPVLENRTIAGQNVVYLAHYKTGEYLWPSGNKAVRIDWGRVRTDATGSEYVEELPEAFVAAYLAVLPSDLPRFAFDERHRREWIRAEVDRHFYYITEAMQKAAQAQDADTKEAHLSFADQQLELVVRLRAEYYGGPSRQEWENRILLQFQARHPGADPKLLTSEPEETLRVNEVKGWWKTHRDDRAVLANPTGVPSP